MPIEGMWKDIGVRIPSLLPLQAAPQDEGQVVPYLQALHNYLAGDRQTLARSLNVLSRFRLLIADNENMIENLQGDDPSQVVIFNTTNQQFYYAAPGEITAPIEGYLPSTGGTIDGNLYVTGTLEVDGVSTFNEDVIISLGRDFYAGSVDIRVNETLTMDGRTVLRSVVPDLYVGSDNFDNIILGAAADRPTYSPDGDPAVDLALYSDVTAALALAVLHDGTRALTGDWDTGGVYGIESPWFQLDLAFVDGVAEGRMQWNAEDGTVEFGLPGGNVNLQVGQEQLVRCRNTTGVVITNGSVVYTDDASGNKPLIKLADASVFNTAVILGVATEDIANNSNGYVNTAGLVRDVDTDGMGVGSYIFLSEIAGEFTTTRPLAPSVTAAVGMVVVDHPTIGVIYVRPIMVPRLSALSDVLLATPVEGDVPRWDAGNSRFEYGNLTPYEEFFQGTIEESFDALVTEAAGVVTMSIEQAGGAGGDLTMWFSDGATTLDCTPAATIVLTAGSDSSPQSNYVYIPQSSKVLTLSTTQWPSGEHIKVGYFLLPSATEVGTDGAFINQNWNDHRAGTDEQGHLAHIGEMVRLSLYGARWHSGVAANAAGSEYLEITGAAPSVVEFKSTAGVGYQMHRHVIPALDMSAGDDCHVVNWSGDSYHEVTDLADIVDDAAGASLSNRYFNLVFWGVANKTGEYSPLMCNLPTGSYVSASNALVDADGYDVVGIPREFAHESSTGFLICRITCKQTPGGAWTIHGTSDLRGQSVGASAGSGASGGSLTEFPDNQFTLYNVTDITKIVDFDLSGLTTGVTRTITPADAAMTIPDTANWTDLTDAGETTLHTHANIGDGPWLPLSAGSGSGLTGDLYVDTSTNPSIFMREAGGWTRYATYKTSGDTLFNEMVSTAGNAELRISAIPSATGTSEIRVGYGTGTTGTRTLNIYDGSTSKLLQHQFNLGTGDVNLCQQGGDLFIDSPTTPAIFLRAGGHATRYSRFQDDGSGSFLIDSITPSGTNASIFFNPLPTDSSDYAIIKMFSSTDTSAGAILQMFVGDGTANVQNEFQCTTGDVNLCKQGGNLTVEEGNVYIDKASEPGLYMREGGSATDYSRIRDAGATCYIQKFAGTGNATVSFSPIPDDNTSNANMHLFRSTNTSGNRDLTIYLGDGTATIQHLFRSSNGVVSLCQQSGKLVLGGPLQLPYLGAAPTGLTNGMAWMESDGLHIYYNSAEKVVAGV